jgi:uncharacterized membrane protein YeiH
MFSAMILIVNGVNGGVVADQNVSEDGTTLTLQLYVAVAGNIAKALVINATTSNNDAKRFFIFLPSPFSIPKLSKYRFKHSGIIFYFREPLFSPDV